MRHLIKPTLTLALICSISAGAIGFTHTTTTRVIAERRQKEFNLAIQTLLPEATHFEEVRGEDSHYILASRGSDQIGAIVPVTTKGYGGDMVILVAFRPDGSVHDVTIFSHSETSGIGDKVLDSRFLGQFINKTVQDKFAVGGDIQAISGATVSSRAVISGVKKAVSTHQQQVAGIGSVEEPLDLARIPDGVYQGSADGFKSKITVEVAMTAGKRADVKVVAIDDTPEIADGAVAEIKKRIVAQQNWKVDAVSGATYTSGGMMNAVKAALSADAGGAASITFDRVVDGEYTGEAAGFGGPISVKVHVAGGKLTKVEILSHKETPGVADPAFKGIPKAMIEKQSVEVDVISGATIVSEAVIEAVKKALASASSR
ncbi:MAG: RnfABCDGE type electron transport complex subunit G [Bacillota bacterium]